MQSVVIVGASLAGLRAAERLRRSGFDGVLSVVGAEAHLPYDRPPLSKQLLAGEWEPERAALTSTVEGGVEGLDVDWHLGCQATGLDTWNRQVKLDNGEALHYEGLIIATGARPVTLDRAFGGKLGRGRNRSRDEPGLAGVHTLRTMDDCLAVRAALDSGPRRVVVVGAGFIGAEVAATCRQRGLEVSLIEALPVPMERAVGSQVGALMADIHLDHGVDVRLGVGVKRFDGDTQVERVKLADGATLEADLVIVGVGVTPNVEWLKGSGVSMDNGVLCDASLRVGPSIVAAGDVARWESGRYGGPVRVEHWENAVTMGEHAAQTLLHGAAGSEPYDPVPWFWSDQYDRKVQLAGLVGNADEMLVVDGSMEERRFAAIYRRDDRIVGVLTMNRPRQMITYRKLVTEGASWDEALAR